MKKNVLIMACLLGMSVSLFAQTQVDFVIEQTSVEYDPETGLYYNASSNDGEFENDELDKFFDDDLDMGWEGEDLNIMTTYLRYTNINIPQGATILSAKIVLFAHEDEADPAYLHIYAEDADNSSVFNEDELLSARTWTTTTLDWDVTESWTMWQEYETPNFKDVVQEVINRAGWVSGNALTIFIQGENQGASLLDNARDFESFENIEDPENGGDGQNHPERIPQLVITYQALSVEDHTTKENLNVFPTVSANGDFTVSLDNPSKTEIKVYDIAGNIVYSAISENGKHHFHLNSSNGVYFVQATQNDKIVTQKVIIR